VTLDVTNLALVAALAFAAPLALGLAPALRLPAIVLELVLGIVLGPAVLGWVEQDDPVRVRALGLLARAPASERSEQPLLQLRR
jgi:Kef-type K+ transport system membrane component KefB